MTGTRPQSRRLTRRQFLHRGAYGAAALGVFGVAGCGDWSGRGQAGGSPNEADATGPPQSGGILQFAVTDAAPDSLLDPALTEITDDTAIGATLYEGLVRYDDEWNVMPVLAEKWESNEDGSEWTFTLREGVTFHDGSPLTAEDVGYSIGRNLDEELGSAIYARMSGSLDPKGIKPVDDRTITFQLKRPDSLFTLAVGARQGHVVRAGTTDFSDGNGTGPFRLNVYDPGRGWEVERNPNYWDPGKPYLDGIRSIAILDQATKVQSVVAGESDFGDRMDAAQAAVIEASSTAKMLVAKAQTYLVISMDSTQEPFGDPRIQMAVKLATDREQLLQVAQQGYGSVAKDVPVTSDAPYFPPSLDGRHQDIDRAKKLLADAGYPDGIDLTLYTSDVFGGLVDMAVAFKQVVAPAGIRVEINRAPADTYWDQVWLVKPMYTSYYQRRHPNESLSLVYISNAQWNEPQYKSDKLDALVAEGMATTDPEEQDEIYRRALKLIADEAGTMIPYFIDTLWPAKNNVQGIILDPQRSVMFNEAWLA